MFRHVVVFRWIPEATEAQVQSVIDALTALPDLVPTLRAYRFGSDAGLVEGNYDFAVVADFDDVDGFLTYRDHPDHRAVMSERISQIMAERVAVQFDAG